METCRDFVLGVRSALGSSGKYCTLLFERQVALNAAPDHAFTSLGDGIDCSGLSGAGLESISSPETLCNFSSTGQEIE
jgi:hypothetical protein